MSKKVYLSISNGDYNADIDINDMELPRFELNEGCQNYVIITKEPLKDKDFSKICKILDRYYK